MEALIKEKLEGIKFGDVQVHKHVAVIPVTGANGSGPEYLTMKEALAGNLLIITEVSEGGHVPELKVNNKADIPILLLDGEELAGAKQNRVLNTTILLREKMETIIPVSCTEQGRWSYSSARFSESGHVMSAKLRAVKNASVHENLKSNRAYRSNQGAVWGAIDCMARINDVDTETGAMKDVLEARQKDLDEYLENLPLVPNQHGFVVLVNGQVAGLDIISSPGAFALLHPKLIKSYVMDALTEKPAKGEHAYRGNADAFLARIAECEEHRFTSVGYGNDYRYEGKKIVGSALVHESTVIHMAFFQTTETEKAGSMSSVSRRRAYRTMH